MSARSTRFRKLGKDGPEVPTLGYGLISLAGFYGSSPDKEARFAVLDHAAKIGETFWDSSDIYGDSETMLGEWFKRTGKRNEIFLATKFGIQMQDGKHSINSSAAYCKDACESSLKKLGVGSIDLFYAHRLNPETPVEETMRAMAELQAEGKIKHIGLSEVSSNTLRRACNIAPVTAVQIEYSPFTRDIEGDTGKNVLAACRELGVAVVCYSPLGRGLLTGDFNSQEAIGGAGDGRAAQFPRFSGENLETNAKIVSQFKEFADRKDCTPSQLAIAWLLKQGNDIFPIPGTKRIEKMSENWAALDVDLSDKDEAEIRAFVESNEMAGYRSTPAGMHVAFVDTKEEK